MSTVSEANVGILPEQSHEFQNTLRDVLETVQATIAPIWPLQDYVAVNPYQGLSDQNFLDARSRLRSFSDCEMLMPFDYYRSRFQDGKFLTTDIEQAVLELAEEGVTGSDAITSTQLVEWLRGGIQSGPDPIPSRSCWSFSREFDIASNSCWTDVISEELSKVCSAHYDLGQALWMSPWKSESLYNAWRERNIIDRRMELKGLAGFRKFVSCLPHDAFETLELLLLRLNVPRSHWATYLLSIAYETPGWAAFTRYQTQQSVKRGEIKDEFVGLLAMRLAYDCAIAENYQVSVDWLDRLHSPEPLPPEIDVDSFDPNGGLVRYALMLANENGFRRQFLAGIGTKQVHQSSRSQPKKLAQMVFCIDVRSERIRRHIEATTENIDTFGFAGFFGVPMEYVRLGEEKGSIQLPVLVDPAVKVKEAVRAPGKATCGCSSELITKKTSIRVFRKLWHSFQKSAASCFTFVEAAGLGYGVSLARNLMGFSANGDHRYDAIDAAERGLAGPTLAGLEEQGYSIDRLADLAQGILTNLGLTKDFARIVVFCGHASQVENNPMQSGLDCGACAGHSGESNARFAAMLMNDPKVRQLLLERGFEIPEAVHFLAGLHNTTTDEIQFLDTDLVPDTHHDDLSQICNDTQLAGERTRQERASTLGSKSGEQLADRSCDWSEVRPEWGLTGNAAFVIGPRELTASCNLSGRSFMHSYNEANDPEGKILEQIMTAPMIVTNWINMQYFASTVDQKHFGCGNKTIHNVVGKFGILEGNGGDLRAGLAWQSLHDGQSYIHDPVRLLVVIAAKRSSIQRIISAHENVANLVSNGWIRLVANEEGKFYRCTPNLSWMQISS